jgi:hypothetical protein
MIKKVAGIGMFALAIFVVIEISYRIYVVGPLALNPFKANSLNVLMRSEFVQLAEFPDVYYELKPDISSWFKGVRFTTNSAGLADREYSLDKPAGVFRVAVVGSSWTMPSGIEHQQAWHAAIEEQLNSQKNQTVKYEFINFGVEQYGLRELVGTARHKVMAWQPDLIVVAVTGFTTALLWEEPHSGQELPERAYPVFVSYVLRAAQKRLGLEPASSAAVRARFEPDDYAPRLAQIQRALTELNEISVENSVPVVVMFLGYSPFGKFYEIPLQEQGEQLTVELLFGNHLFMVAESERRALQISRYDRHPNSTAHSLIAGFLADALADQGLLPQGEL